MCFSSNAYILENAVSVSSLSSTTEKRGTRHHEEFNNILCPYDVVTTATRPRDEAWSLGRVVVVTAALLATARAIIGVASVYLPSLQCDCTVWHLSDKNNNNNIVYKARTVSK